MDPIIQQQIRQFAGIYALLLLLFVGFSAPMAVW